MGEHIWIEGFDRNEFAGLGIGRAIDLAHPAPTEQVLSQVVDAKAIGDKLTGAHGMTCPTVILSTRLTTRQP
jgi:hypothetical protein